MAALTAITLAWTAGVAVAAELSDPQVTGEPFVGETLTADATWSPPDAQVSYRWQRCADTFVESCQTLDAHESTYVVQPDDVGSHLRVVVRVRDSRRWVSKYSPPTEAITQRPAGEPTPDPGPAPDPTPEPATEEPVVPPAVTPPAPVIASMLDPFPLVRVRGYVTRNGARLTMLRVTAPPGVRIAVRCRGESCPREKLARATRRTRLRPYERSLRAGTRLVIRITRDGFIGKHSKIVIRRDKPPSRKDRCLYPGDPRPRRCPS